MGSRGWKGGATNRWSMGDRLRGAFFGLGTGMVLLVLGVLVARHKERLLERYRRMQAWQW